MTQFSVEFARRLDAEDPMRPFRDQFHIPKLNDGSDEIYFVGNSLGLQPKITASYVAQELEQWQKLGVRGHFEGEFPWMPYHEFLTETMANLVGGLPFEVVVMNSLTTNLHLMMATFYRPSNARHKILIENHAFPSDHYAVESQIRLHGYDPADSLVEVYPATGCNIISTNSVCDAIRQQADSLALVMLPGVQYYTGQVFDMQTIVEVAHDCNVPIGFDLAHAAGNVELKLHEWNVDFAVWCSYKYLNSGPGSIAGCFVNERHAKNVELNRLAGWWGHNKETRFQMRNEFQPIPTAEGWQLSNPPILSLAAIRASLDVVQQAGGMPILCQKSKKLTGYLADCLTQELADEIQIMTPLDAHGCQLSLAVKTGAGRQVYDRLESAGVRTDWREPNGIRVAPVPLYNSFEDVFRFVEILKGALL